MMWVGGSEPEIILMEMYFKEGEYESYYKPKFYNHTMGIQ